MRKVVIWMSGLAIIATCIACGSSDEDADLGSGGSAGVDAGTGGSVLDEAGTLHGLAIVNPSCGTGDGGPDDACITCATSSCVPEFESCFGAGWQTTLAGGTCTTFGQCVMDCDCGDNQCFRVCLADLEKDTASACYGCVTTLFTCEVTKCGDACAEELDDAGTDAGKADGGGGGKPDSGK